MDMNILYFATKKNYWLLSRILQENFNEGYWIK